MIGRAFSRVSRSPATFCRLSNFRRTRTARYANDAAPVALAHCPDCDLWLGERDSCLHISAQVGAAGMADASQAIPAPQNVGRDRPDGDRFSAPVSVPLHAGDTGRE